MLNVGQYKGQYRYMLQAQLYNSLTQAKVITEAALRSGIQRGAINAAWDAIGEVIKAWATEGHSVAVPGLGTMRFSVRAQSVENVEDVSTKLIRTRKVIFTPNTEIKAELAATGINITCYDKDGNLVKQVASKDDGTVEDNEGDNTGDNAGNNTGDSGSSTDQGSSTENQGGGSENQGGGSDDQSGDGGIG